jgi:hypothetical protein
MSLIRQIPQCIQTPIIAVTANATRGELSLRGHIILQTLQHEYSLVKLVTQMTCLCTLVQLVHQREQQSAKETPDDEFDPHVQQEGFGQVLY